MCAIFLFVDAAPTPIQLWDESRIAVNALEMHLTGPSLVTTYGFAPDLWNTKPPLLIWLIWASMQLLGPTEWAVRLPSALAALGTLALVMSFVRRTTRSVAAAALAAILLTLSVGFFGEHGARTGDYDALLTFLTTGYLYLLFFSLHRRRPAAAPVLLAGVAVAAAVMTKSIAGLVPGVGVVLYLLAIRRLDRPFRTPWYVMAGAIALLPPAAFYLAREAAAPGYLAAVWSNDVSDRFMSALDQHGGPPWWYLRAIFFAWLFAAGPIALLSPLALAGARGRVRLGIVFALCVTVGHIAAVSASSTKLPQYALPALPFLAIAAAIAVHVAWGALKARPGLVSPRTALVAFIAVAALVAVQAARFRFEVLPDRAYRHQALYGGLFAALAERGVGSALVVDRGVDDIGVPPGYAAQLRFYQLAWRERLRTTHAVGIPAGAPAQVVASCDLAVHPALLALGPELTRSRGCLAVRRAS